MKLIEVIAATVIVLLLMKALVSPMSQLLRLRTEAVGLRQEWYEARAMEVSFGKENLSGD